MAKNLWKHIQKVRQTSPLVHNITNFVVMNNSANALLAVGASPIMSHAHSEVEDMVNICQSLVINIGTLDEYFVKSMILAAQKANELNKPWVLDPVGAGASPYRNEVLMQLLAYSPTVIRGNASEIMALAQADRVSTKGVDSTAKSDEAIHAAEYVHQKYGSIICISGETDIIVGNSRQTFISNGDGLMTKVTGLGCSATAVIGAFIAVIENREEAVCAATALFSISGELAAHQSKGPGTLQANLLDKLYHLTEDEFVAVLKIRNNG
ncbi:hydroxyethylthiazole kinase [Algoriphagus sp. AGSA1]|uniref:hydroxyethylthiazole kinase n=1 Tax=unclassified Algoriphagus TaxID=2641541 RepID=UPI00178611B8|nr:MULTISPECIES: hydroxyethylthiazole kinase [unclassified Algoriphagus]MCE7056281.1 hydroxyethylthiazole kinase [Algoriphagus sp. AGSA1]